MAQDLSIPITDHNDGDTCTLSYFVRYKKSASEAWINMEPIYDSPILIQALDNDTSYDIEVTRNCCNGLSSTPATITVATTRLTTPSGFTATPGNAEVDLEWSVDPEADNYILQRATNSGFTADLTTVYTGLPLSSPATFNDTELTNGVLYYYRLKSQATGYIDSNYATTSATPNP